MCGIAGYLLTNKISEKTSNIILDMLALQQHRGPDDTGVLGIQMDIGVMEELPAQIQAPFTTKPNLVFGFNRLSILDLSPSGHQPMLHSDSGVVIMMNGEVFNAFDFKEDLIRKGFVFKGSSDTEVVLYLYVAFGLEGLLERINGMFALAIYDGRNKELYLVRDRMGIKPLYVLLQEHRIAFASEMKSFKALPGFNFELEPEHLSEFLLYRNTINATLFKNIVNITPGTYWKIQKDGSIQQIEYYNLHQECTSPIKNNIATVLESALKNAVKRHMISDVKLGCQLSGGVDSSMVTAIAAQEVINGSLETFSIVFSDQRFSEKKYIDQVANQIHLKSHQITMDAQSYFNLIEEATWHFEQPLNHPNTVGIKLLSKEAKKHVTVLLSGEGADECLAGYDRFIPIFDTFWSLKTIKTLLRNKRDFVKYLKLLCNPNERYLLLTSFGSIATASALYPNFSLGQAIRRRKDIWQSITDDIQRKKRKYELITYLPDLLMRQDKMSMAHSIENRVPFLDNEVISAAMNINDQYLIKKHQGKWETKWILKELCAGIFGNLFAYRDKMGFGIPLKAFFLSEEFRSKWDNDYLPCIEKRGIFKTNQLKTWMKDPSHLRSDQLDAIWLMVGFEIWANQYLD